MRCIQRPKHELALPDSAVALATFPESMPLPEHCPWLPKTIKPKAIRGARSELEGEKLL